MVPRAWILLDLPGYREDPRGSTYGRFALDDLPPIERTLDPRFEWLLAEPLATDWAILSRESAQSLEEARSRVFHGPGLRLPESFANFVSSAEPASRIRSGTGCYLDFADHVVPAAGGGILAHFLSDQQWSVHWLLYVGAEGNEAVVATYSPYGFAFEPGETHPDYDVNSLSVFDPRETDPYTHVCSESFSEFIYRYWIENEICFRLDGGTLTDEQRRYLEYYRNHGDRNVMTSSNGNSST